MSKIDETIIEIGKQAEVFFDKRHIFKAMIDPILNKITAFEQKILKHIEGMPKFDKSKGSNQHKLLTCSDEPPEKEYIWCSNHLDDGLKLDIIYPWNNQKKHFAGWMPKSLWENDPIDRLLNLAWGSEQPQDPNSLAYQYAIVAIIHDEQRFNNTPNALYFKSPVDIGGRIALKFIELLKQVAVDDWSDSTDRIITRLNDALQSVKLDIEKQTDDGDNETERKEFIIDSKKAKFRKSKSLRLLKDLSDCPSGVTHNEDNHGKDQPNTLITALTGANHKEL